MASRPSLSQLTLPFLALTLLIACGIPLERAEAAASLPGLDTTAPAPRLSEQAAGLLASLDDEAAESAGSIEQARTRAEERLSEQAAALRDKRLDYDPALIAAIGNQTAGGHTICCPGYACAYGDAILTGEARDHANYGCGCCTWSGWGGGNSSFRSLGSDQALLREAYDEIAAGRPTVIHVAGPYGEHWVCLMGYREVEDLNTLTLDNFLCLDPATGAEAPATERYALFGDGCEHVSDLR